MNNKGFTLIELIVCILVLGIISGISYGGISNVVDKNKEKQLTIILDGIYNAAKLYKSENRYKKNVDEVSLETLIEEGYLKVTDNMIKNPVTSCEITDLDSIQINLQKLQFNDDDNPLCSDGVKHTLCQD